MNTSTPRSEWLELPLFELLEEAQICADIYEESKTRAEAEIEEMKKGG